MAFADTSERLGFDLTSRTKLRVTGSDAARFLNGQTTNDVRKATETAAIHAAVLNAKGRMNAEIFVHSRAGSFLIDADASLRDSLPARLERYVIADDVEIHDVTEEFALFHVIGGNADAFWDVATGITADRFGCAGLDLWFASAEHDIATRKIAADWSLLESSAAETFRIERGIPRWGAELSEEIIPVEANLESSAIDYSKGCYIGQEVISRMKMSGQTNKRLRGLVSPTGAALASGMRLFATDHDGREVGWITSAARSERLCKQIALGFVKRGWNVGGAALSAAHIGGTGGDAVAVQVVDLPFA